jgi:hypothetical protein
MSEIDFNEILAVFQEFGPRRAVPVEDRWRERYPSASPKQLDAWARRCRQIEKVAWSLADKVLSGHLDEGRAKAELGRRFPELDADTLGRTHAQAMYFASK